VCLLPVLHVSPRFLPRHTCIVDAKYSELRKRHSRRGKKDGKSKRGTRLWTVCLSMRSITENITAHSCPPLRYFCSLNLTVSHRIIQGNDCFLSVCAIVFRSPPASHVCSSNGQWSSQLFRVYYSWDWLWKVITGTEIRSRNLRITNHETKCLNSNVRFSRCCLPCYELAEVKAAPQHTCEGAGGEDV
jgi:hypothetical protein